MQAAMDKVSTFLERRRWVVIGVWVTLLVVSLPFALRQTEELTAGGFSVPGSGSEAVDKALADFDKAEAYSLSVVIANKGGGEAAISRELDKVAATVDDVDGVTLSPEAKRAALADAGESPIVVAQLHTTGSADETADVAVELYDDMKSLGGDGAETYLVGQQALWAGVQELSREDLESAERAGFPIVLLILLAVFGSLAAASLPLVLGFTSVMVTGAIIFFLSRVTDMSVFVTNVASMIGIGVAVDYSLFILARYREEISAGLAPDEARRVAMRTSGLAVLFSGITVMVSLAGLFVVNSTTLRSMAMGAIIVVAIALLGATTLLPMLIKTFGERIYKPGRIARIKRSLGSHRRRRGSTNPAIVKVGFWERWTERVTSRPLLYASASAGVLLVMAIPALSLHFGNGALSQFPEGNHTRTGAELAAQKSGPGASGPTHVVAHFNGGSYADPENTAAVKDFVTAVRKDPQVAAVQAPRPARDGQAVLVSVISKTNPESDESRALFDRLRHGGGGVLALQQTARVDVGGSTAAVEDFKDLISGSMWKIALFVLVFSYLVLFVLLRSVLLPLKAVLMNLLSVGAAYGVLVAVFQYGWFDGFMGFESLGYVNTITPPFLLAVVFGLSMDYEVFLLSRIRERYDATGDTKTAVAQGLAKSAATISSAALIMVAVFAVFAGTGVPSIKEIGLGLAVAIALDATLVRLVLVPATMELMDKWNWWMPKRLERILPEANFEASGYGAEA